MNITSYSDTGLSPATTYQYKVIAYSIGGDSPEPNPTDSATTLEQAPAAPDNLAATAVNYERIDLTWTDNADNESGFRIERKSDATFSEIDTVGANVTTYNDNGLTESTTYTYRLLAYNAGGDSTWSNEAVETTPAAITFYRAINLNGDIVTVDGQVWEDQNAPNYTYDGLSFVGTTTLDPLTDPDRTEMIQSSIYNNGNLSLTIQSVPQDTYDIYLYVWEDNAPMTYDLFIEGALVQDDYYSGDAGQWEKLGPYNFTISDGEINITSGATGDINISGIEIWITAPDITPPADPTGLSATQGNGIIELAWNDNTESDFSVYHVYRSETQGGPYTQEATGLTAGEYIDADLVTGNTYYYVVTAEDTNNVSVRPTHTLDSVEQ